MGPGGLFRAGNFHGVERKEKGVGNAPQGEEGARVAGALPGYWVTAYLGTISGSWVREE